MNATSETRAARHARQGTQAAARTFCEIRLNAATAAEARLAIDEALARVDGGSAPQAFKDAVREEFARRFEHAYPGQRPTTPQAA
jgi:hypothetical protein